MSKNAIIDMLKGLKIRAFYICSNHSNPNKIESGHTKTYRKMLLKNATQSENGSEENNDLDLSQHQFFKHRIPVSKNRTYNVNNQDIL